MIDDAVAAAGIGPWLAGIVTVEAAGCFKPHPAVYAHAAREGRHRGTGRHHLRLVQPVGLAGASACGWRAFWINRTGQPEEYPGFPPVAMLPGSPGWRSASGWIATRQDDRCCHARLISSS